MRKILKKTLSISLALLFICICFNRSNTAFAQSDTALYDMVWKLVNAKFLDDTKNSQDWERWRHKYDDKIKTPEDAYVAIDTMLASLNDRYTKFVPPKEFEEEKSMIKGSLFGIGVQIGIRDGKILVVSPIEDTPGEKAGLKPEDEILSIVMRRYHLFQPITSISPHFQEIIHFTTQIFNEISLEDVPGRDSIQ